jgi:16S rRNA (adenine1518-N6/adenine1519-N6)-dimethyltransferase
MGARREAHEALAAAGLRPRKRWGQHFLCDPAVAQRIVDAAALGPDSVVLEIGPGLGALTDELAARAARLYLVEIDRGLTARLDARYAERPHVRVLQGDVLTLPLDELVAEPSATVVANLPYNISTPVVFRLLELRRRFPRAVLTLQREVAVRLASPPGRATYGVTSVLVQAFAEVQLRFAVSRRSFFPRPQIDSTVVELAWTAAPRVEIGDVRLFTSVVRAAFGQRRKMLRNALGGLMTGRGISADAGRALYARAGIDPAARAEQLDLAAFGRLARVLSVAPFQVTRPDDPPLC